MRAACLAACLLLAALTPAFAQIAEPCKANDDSQEVSSIPPSHLELLFNVTHNYGSPAQEPKDDKGIKTRLHLELVDKCAGANAHNVTFIIRIAEPGKVSSAPIIVDAFQTESGVLNLDVISDQNKTAVSAGRDQFLNAYVAEKPDYAITIHAPAIRQNGSYEMDVQLLAIDSAQKMFAPGSEPEAILGWSHQNSFTRTLLSAHPALPPALPMEPVTLKTDRQHYESGDTVRISGNVGPGAAKAINEHAASAASGLRVGVTASQSKQQFVLMDNISNITDRGDFSYSFQMKGVGTMQSGPFTVQVWPPNGNTASSVYNFTYSPEKALASNPMTVDWEGAGSIFANVFDMKYGADPTDVSKQKYVHAFSREMRYKIVPEGAATVENMTATHLIVGDGPLIGASLDIRINAVKNGTLIADIPIDVVEPDQLRLRGHGATQALPFDIGSNAGVPPAKLVYFDEVQHVIALDFTPAQKSLSISGRTAEQLDDSVLKAYVVPEFHQSYIIAALALAVGAAIARRTYCRLCASC